MRIALLGTRGVPPRYGGFETAIDEIGSRLVERGHEVVVYCRNPGQDLSTYRGMRLVNLPALRRKSLETLSHTGLSTLHCLTRVRPDVAVVFNAANAPFIPLFRAARVPVVVHPDGLEWRRAKWAGAGQRFYRWAEGASVRWADGVVADARGIADHLASAYGRTSTFIPYGAPVVHPGHDRLAELGLEPDGYHLVVARLEPENHVDVVVRGRLAARAALPLVVVGTAPYPNASMAAVERTAAGRADVRLLGAVWDQDLLDQLYAHCRSYVHGHSVGGTNPSLLRALGAGAPVTAYDGVFNREVTAGHARFFTDETDVAAALEADEADTAGAAARGVGGQEHVAAAYRWDDVARGYESLLDSLARHRPVRGGVTR